MAGKYYEAHITITGFRDEIKTVVENYGNGWKFSAIDGDIVLGEGVKCYATKHYKKDIYNDVMIAKLQEEVKQYKKLLGGAGVVVRSKVELIIYDSLEKT